MSLARDRPSPGLCRRLNQSQEEFPDHPASGTKAVPDRVSPARVRYNARFENLSSMIAVFLEGNAVIEAQFFLAERQACNHRRHRRWSFYTALPLSSSFFVPEPRARLPWKKSCGLDSVPDVGRNGIDADVVGQISAIVRRAAESARSGVPKFPVTRQGPTGLKCLSTEAGRIGRKRSTGQRHYQTCSPLARTLGADLVFACISYRPVSVCSLCANDEGKETQRGGFFSFGHRCFLESGTG